LIRVADHISSGEREETARGDKDDYIKRRLSSIFNKISLKGESKINEPYFHTLAPLALSKIVFPKKKSEIKPLQGTGVIDEYKDEYRTLWNGFIKDFEKLRDKTPLNSVLISIFF